MTAARVLHFVSGSAVYDHLLSLATMGNPELFEVHIASLAPPGLLHDEAARRGIDAWAVGASTRMEQAAAVVPLARRLRRDRIDVLHTHLFDACLIGTLAGRLARTPLVVASAHHSYELTELGRVLPLLADKAANRLLARCVVAPSERMAEVLSNVEGVPAHRIEVIRNGIDLDAWRPEPANRSRMRAELGLGEEHVALAVVARLTWVKAVPLLVEAFAPLARLDPNLTLLVVGGGDDGPVRRAACAAGIETQVTLLGHRSDLSALLDAIDLLVQPSLVESFGLALIEGMAKGRPVVATRTGVAEEAVREGIDGWLAAPHDVGSLQDALERALAERPRWPEIGASAATRATRYRAEEMVRDHEALYRRLLTDRRLSPSDWPRRR